MSKLKMNLSEDFDSALNRRHNGAKHTKKEIKDMWEILQSHYKDYNKFKKKRDYLLDVEWDEKILKPILKSLFGIMLTVD